jgi:SAM-dependent methyltransferase
MSEDDRQRWERKWAARSDESFRPHPLLTGNAHLLGRGRALDVACGRGQNAIWLAQRGYEVLGVDISDFALAEAAAEATGRGLAEHIQFERVDLDNWMIPAAAFDLICVFRFLDRRLFPAIRAGLRPEGLLFYSTRHIGALRQNPEANTAYLLGSGELLAEFSDWCIVHHEEDRQDASLIAVKTTPM